jgi:hypothetical protein
MDPVERGLDFPQSDSPLLIWISFTSFFPDLDFVSPFGESSRFNFFILDPDRMFIQINGKEL